MADESDSAARSLVLQIAHHDIWWAKSNLWSATNWAILLIAGVVGVAKLFHPDGPWTFSHSWRSVSLVVIISIAACWYLARLQHDIMANRLKARSIRAKDSALDAAFEDLNGPCSDCTRGNGFVLAMAFTIGVVAGIATFFLTREDWLGCVVWLGTFLLACVCLGIEIERCLRRVLANKHLARSHS